MTKNLVLLLALSACKDAPSIPPPIANGKCLVDRYIGSAAKKQTCDYVGYRWTCELDGSTNECNRGNEVSGERDPIIPPPPVAAPIDAGIGAG